MVWCLCFAPTALDALPVASVKKERPVTASLHHQTLEKTVSVKKEWPVTASLHQETLEKTASVKKEWPVTASLHHQTLEKTVQCKERVASDCLSPS